MGNTENKVFILSSIVTSSASVAADVSEASSTFFFNSTTSEFFPSFISCPICWLRVFLMLFAASPLTINRFLCVLKAAILATSSKSPGLLRLDCRWLVTKSGLVAKRFVSREAPFAGSLSCKRENDVCDVCCHVLKHAFFTRECTIGISLISKAIKTVALIKFMSRILLFCRINPVSYDSLVIWNRYFCSTWLLSPYLLRNLPMLQNMLNDNVSDADPDRIEDRRRSHESRRFGIPDRKSRGTSRFAIPGTQVLPKTAFSGVPIYLVHVPLTFEHSLHICSVFQSDEEQKIRIFEKLIVSINVDHISYISTAREARNRRK